jgi:dienelactone hydrolase
MERFVSFSALDGHTIHGTFNASDGRVSESVCLFIHGLTGYRNEPLHLAAVKPFNAAGIAALRIDLYTDEEGGRAFEESSLKTHIDDVASSVEFLEREGFSTIFGVGHSFGAPSLFMGDTSRFTAIALWDPSSQKRWNEEGIPAKYSDRYSCHVIDWGKKIIVGDEMVEGMKSEVSYHAGISKVQCPVIIVSAGKGILTPYSEELLSDIQAPKKHVVIEKAAHCFNEEGCFEKLHSETLGWFLSYSGQ